ncbi:MAG: polyhydroxyalkanoate synthesis regulator DNA-binding domain-containing protein [Ignavibacteriales bacterium]
MPEQVIIKKYSNRRLYDTSHKRYVTLEEIANLIKEGNEIKVIDSQTDEDITKVILMQVVLESEKNKEDILPTSFLHMLIKYGNRMARDFFDNYFLIMFQPYLSLQEGMKKNLRWWQEIGWLPSGPKFPPGMVNPFEAVAEGIERQNNSLEKNGESEVAPTSMDMELLMEKIKELEEKIKSIDKFEKSKEKEKEKDAE